MKANHRKDVQAMRRLAARLARSLRRLILQMPESPYPSGHPWSLRH